MRAKFINEKFTEDSDPIDDMGIGQRHLIIKWFKDVERQKGYKIDYTIDNNLNIFVNGPLKLSETTITNIPKNLTIDGFLDLRGTYITELPDNLSVEGDLDLRDTHVSNLPNNLYVWGNLLLQGLNIKKFPKDLNVVNGGIYK